jgi:hypothetical protein
MEQALMGQGAKPLTPDSAWKEVEPTVEEWWKALKEWESQDTFDVAFAEKRMTIRGVNKGGAVVQFGVKKKTGGSSGNQITLDTSMKGIANRMDPANFEKKSVLVKRWPRIEQHFGKNPMGLHDLSGCLLNPDKPSWTTQYKNYIDPGTFYVLMPVPQVQDLTYFYLLLDEAKRVKSAVDSKTFVAAVKRYGKELTRIKYAAAEDMHTSFVDTGTGGGGKFKYGVTGVYTEGTRTIRIPQQEIDARKVRARNYEGILTDSNVLNEVVIAYRKHGLNGLSNFPMFGLPDAVDQQTTRFARLRIINTNNQPTGWIVNESGRLVQA